MRTLQAAFENRNGHTLRGIVTLPDTEEKVPMVLLLHGFSGNLYGYKGLNTRIARALANAGIGCARFDFYGNGESDGEFQDMRFTGLYEDAEDMFSWMQSQPYADKTRCWLSGQSMGGYVAASTAPKIRPHGLILLCPGGGMWFGCGERAKQLMDQGKSYVDLEGLRYEMSFNLDMASHPMPFEEAKGYEGPAFIARASDDKLVDDRSVQAYAACYQNPETLTVEGGGHNFASLPGRETLTGAIISFIRKH